MPAQRVEYASTKKTETVISHLEERIISDEWSDGCALPSRGQLSREYGVSPATVANAVRTLQKKGLLHVIPGKGAFVKTSDDSKKAQRPTVALRGSYVRKGMGGAPRSSSYCAMVVHAVLEVAHEEHCPLLFLPGNEGEKGINPEALQQQGVHGIIFLGGESYEEAVALREAGFPVIVANEPVGPTPLNYINYDHEACLRDIVSRFAQAGHRRIGVLLPSTTMPGSFEKLKPNFIQALCDHDIQYNVNAYWRFVKRRSDTNEEFSDILPEIEALLDLPEPPTAIFCWAPGALTYVFAALKKRGLEVPRDISLAQAPYMAEVHPPLSGYEAVHHQLARELLQGIHASIENPFYSVQKLLPLRFIDHGSILSPRKTGERSQL